MDVDFQQIFLYVQEVVTLQKKNKKKNIFASENEVYNIF